MDFGRGCLASWTGVDSSSMAGAGVADRRSGGVRVLLLESCSTRAAARAGSFLFLSIWNGLANQLVYVMEKRKLS